MSQQRPQNNESPPTDRSASDQSSPLSLSRLRAAFAEMLGTAPPTEASSPGVDSTEGNSSETGSWHTDPCEISPRSVVEAMLFVGRPDNSPLSSREMAASMRGVSPREIDDTVTELNKIYQQDAAPYRVVGTSDGFRLDLCDEFSRMRDKIHGRVREARLSPAALEVLSIVAYNQPATGEQINSIRGVPSGGILANLVRRHLVRIDRDGPPGTPPRYATTDRFLRLFGLENLGALPRSEEFQSE